ncbi:MAG: hypothetical protein LBS43_08360 [Prevotellaceae bacterium]|nr:hypothetical protein [Prevotellaceae bacterium]
MITKKDGSEISAKVIEIDLEVIRYKQYDNQTGPTYVLAKSDVFRIKYEDGRIEVYGATANPVTETTTATPPQQTERTPVTAAPYQADWQAQMQANAPDIYQRFRRGTRQSKVGLGLTIGGMAAIITGYAIIGSTVEDNTLDDEDLGTVGAGALVAVAGSILTAVGTPIMIVGFVKKGKAKREYFSRYGNRASAQKSPLQSPHLEIRTNGIAFVF